MRDRPTVFAPVPLMGDKRRVYVRFLRGLRPFLNNPVSREQARAIMRWRLSRRHENFLRLMRHGVFDNAASPYLQLLKRANCTYDDMVESVHRHGLETFLLQLKRAGVWISLDEFKGVSPIRRDSLEVPVRNDDFRNPFTSAGFEVGSGGSSGLPSRTNMDLDFLAERAVQDHLHFELLDLYHVPLALWYPPLPAVTGVSNSLRYARIGQPPARWFCLLSDERARFGLRSHLATRVMIWASRFTRCPLASPEPTPLEQTDKVLRWILDTLRRHRRCALQSYVSQAVRIGRLASEQGVDLTGMQFLVDSEPVTPAKVQQIESTGAKVFARYAATETGLIAMGCGRPRDVGEYHLALDGMAMIQDSIGPGPAPFYFTSLWGSAPCVLLNVQLGDSGVMDEHRCGCLFEEAGMTTHLRQVASTQRATGEGMALDDWELVRLAEELLPAWYGGSPLDYQWVEQEDPSALTRLFLRVDERVGPIDDTELVSRALAEFARTRRGAVTAAMWREAGTIRVLRQKPRLSSTGKHLPLWRRSAATSGEDGALG